jgi:hypothetical protein
MESLLSYIYTFGYRVPPDPEEQLLLHLLMYAMGHNYDILHLKKDATSNFARTYLKHWASVKFSDFIPFAYRVSSADDRLLRDIIITLATHNVHYLFETDPDFKNVFIENGEFGKDMALTSCGLLKAKGESILEDATCYKPLLYLQCSSCVSISRCNKILTEKAAADQGYPRGLYPCPMCSSLAPGFAAKPNWDVYICSECHEPVHVLSGNRFTPLRCPLVPCPGIPAPLEEVKAARRPHPYTAGLFQSIANREKAKATPCDTNSTPANAPLSHIDKQGRDISTAAPAGMARNNHNRFPSVTETENSFDTPESVGMERILAALDHQAEDTPTRVTKAKAPKLPRQTPPRLELEYSAYNLEGRKNRPHLGLWKSPSRWFTKEAKDQ